MTNKRIIIAVATMLKTKTKVDTGCQTGRDLIMLMRWKKNISSTTKHTTKVTPRGMRENTTIRVAPERTIEGVMLMV